MGQFTTYKCGTEVPSDEINQQAVAMIEKVLERIRLGEIHSVFICTQQTNGDTGSGWAISDQRRNVFNMLGCVTNAVHDFQQIEVTAR